MEEKSKIDVAKVQLKLDLRKNCQKPDGSFPLVLAITHLSKTRTISLKYSFTPEKWDDVKLKPKNIPNNGAKINSQLKKAQLFIRSNQLEIEGMPISKLKILIQSEILSKSLTNQKAKERYIATKENTTSLVEFAYTKINRLKLSKKFGNATAITTGINAVCKFKNSNDLLFSSIDINFLTDFCAFCCSKGNKPNTISAYLRPIKTLFNEALADGMIPTNINPFPKFKIPSSPKTKNRALRMEEINKIRDLDLKPNSAVWNARNYFLFMFNNLGLSIIDLVKLKNHKFLVQNMMKMLYC